MTDFLDDLISSLREKLAVLDRQWVAIDLQRARVVKALSALEEPFPPAAGAQPLAESAVDDDAPSLANRVLDVLRRSGPLPRARILKVFKATDVNPSTLDSALYRLKAKGLIGKRGPAFFALPAVGRPDPAGAGSEAALAGLPPSASASAAPETYLLASALDSPAGEPASLAAGAPLDARRSPASPPAGEAVPVPTPSSEAQDPRTVRVCAVLATAPGGLTRAELVARFAPDRDPSKAVDRALRNLRKSRYVELRPDGKYVVRGGSGAPSLSRDGGDEV